MRAIVFVAALAAASAGPVADWSIHDRRGPSTHLGDDLRHHHEFKGGPPPRAEPGAAPGPWAGYPGNATHTSSGAYQFFPPPSNNRLVGPGLAWDSSASWTIGEPAHHPDLNPIVNYDVTFNTSNADGFSEGSVVDIKGSKLRIQGARFIVGETNRKCSIECALSYDHDTAIGHFQITHDSTSRHTHHYCFKVGCNAWDIVGCACQCKCCDELNQPAGYCDNIPTNYDEEGPVGPTITSHPTPSPTPEPTPAPTPSPTHMHCDPNTNTHTCWKHPSDPSIFATCVPDADGITYDCVCPDGTYSNEIEDFGGHYTTPPHECSTHFPTPSPTPAPTAMPTCNDDWQAMGDDIDGEAAFDTLGMKNTVDLSADGKILAVGSSENDGNGRNSGHVRTFKWTSGRWSQMGPDIEGEDSFMFNGASLALSKDGHSLAIGARDGPKTGKGWGRARVYQWNKNSKSWIQKGFDIFGLTQEKHDWSGAAIDISEDGNTVAVGAYKNSGGGQRNGHVRVHQWTAGAWKQIGSDINGEEIYSAAGVSVDLAANGKRLAIGAHENSDGESKYHAGHVRVYEFNGDWKQMGQDVNGESQHDYSGSAISLNKHGDVLAVGAYKNDGAGTDAGHVRMYHWTGHNWAQMGQDIDGQAAYDNFGVSVDLAANSFYHDDMSSLPNCHSRNTDISGSGSHIDCDVITPTVAIGAWGNDDAGINAGHAQIYWWDGKKWNLKGASALTGDHSWDHSGSSVDLSANGHTLAVGARYHSPSAAKRMAGHVKVYSTCAELQGVSGETEYSDNKKDGADASSRSDVDSSSDTDIAFMHPTKSKDGVNYLFKATTAPDTVCQALSCKKAYSPAMIQKSSGQVCKIWQGSTLADVGCGTTAQYISKIKCSGCKSTDSSL